MTIISTKKSGDFPVLRCKYSKCRKRFKPKVGWQKFHNTRCRWLHWSDKHQRPVSDVVEELQAQVEELTNKLDKLTSRGTGTAGTPTSRKAGVTASRRPPSGPLAQKKKGG